MRELLTDLLTEYFYRIQQETGLQQICLEENDVRVTDLLECPYKVSFKGVGESARINDGILLDKSLKDFFLEKFPNAKTDLALSKTFKNIRIVGHPDIVIPDLAIIDIKYTQSRTWKYPTETILNDVDLFEKYEDQVKIYNWMLGNQLKMYLIGRVTLKFGDRLIDRFFIKEINEIFTDEKLEEFLNRVPRYDYECKYCQKREECVFSKYVKEKISSYELRKVAKSLGYNRFKQYKGWKKWFSSEGGIVYSDGALWKIEYIGEYRKEG